MQSIIQFEGCHEFVIVVDVLPLSTTCEGIEMGLSRIAGGEWSREDFGTWSAEEKPSGLHQKRSEGSSNATKLGRDRSYDMQDE